MNRLDIYKRVMILNMLIDGMPMRSISRTVGVSINTVSKLLVAAGEACAEYYDQAVRDVKSTRIQCDEIWSFVYAKAKNVETATAAPDGAGVSDTQHNMEWIVGLIDARAPRSEKARPLQASEKRQFKIRH